MKMSNTLCFVLLFVLATYANAEEPVVWIEAECAQVTGGWSRDTQHVDLMGSTYLLATGVGRPVEDAVTYADMPQAGTYHLWVRCRDWLPSHSPGKFQVLVDGKASKVFGASDAGDDAWRWHKGGSYDLKHGRVEVRLHDLTGWWGRVDAIVLAPQDFTPDDDLEALAEQRLLYAGVSTEIEEQGPFDVVVVGAGPAGMGAAVAAARNGAKVALVQDRPVVGGNSSSEISVPPMGYIGSPPDRVNVTGLAEEFFPVQGWSNFADSHHMEAIIVAEPNITLFLNTRATDVIMKGEAPTARPLEPGEEGVPGTIESVIAIDVRTSRRKKFSVPLFIDCTGHGWIGYYAGAEYRQGQEARAEFNESLAPVEAGTRTQGNTLYQAFIETRDEPAPFDCPDWAYQWRTDSDFQPRGDHVRTKQVVRPPEYDLPAHGKGRNPGDDLDGSVTRRWWVEYGGMADTVYDAEKIRDELLRINIGLWNYAKNHNPKTKDRNARRELVWLNYVPGVRESRRLIGPRIMTQAAWDDEIIHEDTIAFTDWGPDVHHPEGFWVSGNDCIHVYQGLRASIPYRSLYSRNISNLLMAGRCHSATHIAMGGTRVMRPCMGMGQAAGTAAAIAAQNDTNPHGVYEKHLAELQQMLLKDGCFLMGMRNEDPRDLVQSARVTATSAADGMPATEAADGYTRITAHNRNAWLATGPGPHRLQFDFDGPQRVNVAHITFESRAATTRIEALVDGQWAEAAVSRRRAEPGYPLRRLVVPLKPVEATAVRLTLPQPAAICEVRLYNEPDDAYRAIESRWNRLAAKASQPILPGVFIDDTQAELTGPWEESTWKGPFFYYGYSHDGDAGKGQRAMTFRPSTTGRFDVRLAYVAYENRATNVPVTILHANGETEVVVDQREEPPVDGRFISLGVFELDEASAICVKNDGTDGYVIVDGVQLSPVE